MFNAPYFHRFLLAVCAPLLLPLAASAQFTGMTFPPARTGLADFSTALGDALEVTFENTRSFDGSCGSLDRGFGTYVAPRRDPALWHRRIYLKLEHDGETLGNDAADAPNFSHAPGAVILSASRSAHSSTLDQAGARPPGGLLGNAPSP